jgi:hypothetical protein
VAGSVGSLDDELSEGDSDGGADVSSGLFNLVGLTDLDGDSDADSLGDVGRLGNSLGASDCDRLGERVRLGSEAVIDPLGEGRSMEPSPPQEVRRTASSAPAADAAVALFRFVSTVVMVAPRPLSGRCSQSSAGLPDTPESARCRTGLRWKQFLRQPN